ncbi:MAG: HAD family phosphatase [Bacteroidales bacterium]|jgi:putative hydrolase of the HAD superfamily|nr:HAD family phosphatase [Bacteroidales bacterium]MDD2577306.1 HAD family phosphatase [Bacteroidales bacterium]MDD4068050.1 HAD family phosphatase [Bacteroidales bacterium]MDD4739655.1 HAD family phosphatase [Bacteroidales bacterium]
MSEIKNLLLDLGGVVLNVDYHKMVDVFKEYGVMDFDKHFTQAKQVEIIDKFEEGKCTIEEFRNGIRDLINVDLTDKQIDNAWFSMILDLPKERIELIGLLKLKYNVYLFSNTNELHIELLKKRYEEEFGFDIFQMLFTKAYFSNEIKMRKPHPESFQWLLNDAEIKAEETLFIEDSPQHIEGAKKVGLNTYWLTGGETINDLYDKKII